MLKSKRWNVMCVFYTRQALVLSEIKSIEAKWNTFVVILRLSNKTGQQVKTWSPLAPRVYDFSLLKIESCSVRSLPPPSVGVNVIGVEEEVDVESIMQTLDESFTRICLGWTKFAFQDLICGSSRDTDLITRNQRLSDRIRIKVTQPSPQVEYVHMIHRYIYWKMVSSLYNCFFSPLYLQVRDQAENIYSDTSQSQ